MHEPSGRLFDVLDRDSRELIATTTIESLVELSEAL